MNEQQNEQREILALVREIRDTTQSVNERMTGFEDRIANVEQAAIRKGAKAGAVAGGMTCAIMTVGIELIRAKFGL